MVSSAQVLVSAKSESFYIVNILKEKKMFFPKDLILHENRLLQGYNCQVRTDLPETEVTLDSTCLFFHCITQGRLNR